MKYNNSPARTIGVIGFSILLHGAAFWAFSENVSLKRMAEAALETHREMNRSQLWEQVAKREAQVEVNLAAAEVKEEPKVKVEPKVEAPKVQAKAKKDFKFEKVESVQVLPKKEVVEEAQAAKLPEKMVVSDVDTAADSEKEVESTDLLSELEAAEPTTLEKIRSYLGLKQASGNRPPSYPLEARKQGLQGRVLLKYFVTESGSVKDLQVAESSGYKILDDEALRAVSSYRFFPGQEGWTEHPVKFSLNGAAGEIPAELGAAN